MKNSENIENKKNNISFHSLSAEFLGTPVVDESFGSNAWINFGQKNDFPNELLDLFQNASPIHSAIIKRKADMVAGNGFLFKEELKYMLKNKFSEDSLNEIVYKIALDIVLFGGFYLEVIWNAAGDYISQFEHIPFQKVRVSKPNNPGYWISRDWMKYRKKENEPFFMPKFNPSSAQEDKKQIFQYKVYSPGMEYYSLPTYQSALNYIRLDLEISTFHLRSVQNGLTPGMIVILKDGIPTDDQKQMIIDNAKASFQGSNNAGETVFVFCESDEKKPEFVPIQLAATDERFNQMMQLIDEKIMLAHNFTAAVAGLEVEGKLGARQELEEQIDYLQNTVITPIQIKIENVFDKFGKINEVEETFELNNFDFYSKEIIEKIQ
jgi:hypothetical protein